MERCREQKEFRHSLECEYHLRPKQTHVGAVNSHTSVQDGLLCDGLGPSEDVCFVRREKPRLRKLFPAPGDQDVFNRGEWRKVLWAGIAKPVDLSFSFHVGPVSLPCQQFLRNAKQWIKLCSAKQ